MKANRVGRFHNDWTLVHPGASCQVERRLLPLLLLLLLLLLQYYYDTTTVLIL